ncbi:MAG: acyl-CoA dehydrogenase family protein [Candidatus Rokubacteria bacterium]|nr:acyl-CoA dehydrogenase family protein [Candidatus Rokubacteria bacterium]
MLDFSFTPEQERLRQMLRAFALRELLPHYARWDRERQYPKEQVKKLCRLLWTDDPGERLDLISAGIVAEEVARGGFNCVLMSLGPFQLREFLKEAPAALRDRWIRAVSSGESAIALALTEPEAGSDMGAMRTVARQDGDHFVLSGEKNSVSFLNADVFYVFARTEAGSAGWKGISAFLVPRDTPGLSFREYEDMGCRAVPRGQLFLDEARVPAANMVGARGGAFPMIMSYLDVNRAFIGPISRFEGVAFPLAEAATLVEAARWLCYRILWKRERGEPCTAEGAMAKWWAPKISAEIIHECLLLHGHYGYTQELPLEQRLRDVIGWQIGDGTPQIQKLIIARQLLGREFAPETRQPTGEAR